MSIQDQQGRSGAGTEAGVQRVTIANDSTGAIGSTSPYPKGATPITAASGNVANATATATLAAVAGKTTYITGFTVTGTGATAGLAVSVSVAGTITTGLTYTSAAAVGALIANTPLIVRFNPAVPASATNIAIAVSIPALGLGNTNSTVVAHGYQL